jgi:hypothetical protein
MRWHSGYHVRKGSKIAFEVVCTRTIVFLTRAKMRTWKQEERPFQRFREMGVTVKAMRTDK